MLGRRVRWRPNGEPIDSVPLEGVVVWAGCWSHPSQAWDARSDVPAFLSEGEVLVRTVDARHGKPAISTWHGVMSTELEVLK